MLTQTIGWGLASAMITILTSVVSPAVVSIVGDEAAEIVDLSSLSDGETRTFGSGEHVITATRNGESIAIALPAGEDGRVKTIDCRLGGPGGCFAFTTGDAAGVKVIAVDGQGGDSVRRKVEIVRIGGDEGTAFSDHEAQVLVLKGDGDVDAQWESLIDLGGAHGQVVRLHGDERILRCPEGDTTMRLDEDDTATYSCPRHDVALEPLEVRGGGVHKIVIRTDEAD